MWPQATSVLLVPDFLGLWLTAPVVAWEALPCTLRLPLSAAPCQLPTPCISLTSSSGTALPRGPLLPHLAQKTPQAWPPPRLRLTCVHAHTSCPLLVLACGRDPSLCAPSSRAMWLPQKFPLPSDFYLVCLWDYHHIKAKTNRVKQSPESPSFVPITLYSC